MKKYFWLIIIIFVATFLRFFDLGKIPSSLTPDEAAQGYTAYSYIQTGHDEWGSRNPLIMQSFGDYKPPFQTWLIMISIKKFGLNQFAIRLPNAVFGVVTVILIYLISQSTLAGLLAAVSPWLLPISRLALESNIIITVFLLGFWLFLNHKKSSLYLFSSAICFGLTAFIYHSAKIVTPLFIVGLFNIYRSQIKNKHWVTFFIIFLSIFLFNIFINSSAGLSRSQDIIIFNPTDKWADMANSRYQLTQFGLPPILSRLIANKITFTFKTFTNSYFSYFSPQFLVTSGAGETTYGMIPGFGVIGFIGIIGIISSIIYFLKYKKINPEITAIIVLIFISPLPAAIAKGQYSANRVSLLAPALIILSAFGLNILIKKIKLAKYFLIVLLVLESVVFLATYFFQANALLCKGMLFGHEQINEYLKKYPDYNVVYSRRLSEPQAYYLFYQQFSPQSVVQYTTGWQRYQEEGRSFVDQMGSYSLANVVFRDLNINSDIQLPKTIIIGPPDEFIGLKPSKVIYYPESVIPVPAVYIINTNEK